MLHEEDTGTQQRAMARGKEHIVKFHSLEQFAELDRLRLRKAGLRVVIAAVVGAVALAAVVLALPFG